MRSRIFLPLLLALALLLPAREALACSIMAPAPQNYIDQAQVIAIGKLTNIEDDVFTVQVEEYLKGAQESQELIVNNHQFGIGASCDESLGAGGRFTEEMQVLIFLEQDPFNVGSDWRPAGIGGFGVFAIRDGQLELADNGNQGQSVGTLEETRKLIVEQVGSQPPAAEPTPQPAGGQNQGGASGAAGSAEGLSLPQVLLMVLLAITAALGGWSIISAMKRRSLR